MNIEKVIKVINLVSNENRSAEEEKEFIDFILNCESDIYSGKDEDGNDIVVALERNVGARISTYQSNGWIKVVDYDIVEDENGHMDIQLSETYEK